MKNLWRTSVEPLRVVLAPSPSLSVLFSDAASAIETTAPNHSFMPLWLSGGKIHQFTILGLSHKVKAPPPSLFRLSQLHGWEDLYMLVLLPVFQDKPFTKSEHSSVALDTKQGWLEGQGVGRGGRGDQEDISPSLNLLKLDGLQFAFT